MRPQRIPLWALIALIIALIAVPTGAAAQRETTLREVVVAARRPMKDIGIQKTPLDSAQLKENIALSMADVLAYGSSIFVKSYGRATLSTVAFRGTSPSHTQVTWNGLHINSPMLGMTDFSTIPAYFIDRADLLHGSSSVGQAGGGLGGLVQLQTAAPADSGLHAQYIQGAGSFRTFDEFARVAWKGKRWSATTRAVYSSSPNDYKYTNHDKKLNIYDDAHNIVGQYNPTERNRSGAFKDFHLLQEAAWDGGRGDKLALAAWLTLSDRELPMTTTDYAAADGLENRQREHTLRAVGSWAHTRETWTTTLRAGYLHTWMAYDYRRETTPANWMTMTRSRSRTNTFYGQADGEWAPAKRWYLTASIAAHQNFAKSEDKNIILQDGGRAIVGYDKGRIELSGSMSAKWQPTDRIGLALTLRQEMYGTEWAPLIPAFFCDALLSKRGKITLKASVSRNYHFPGLNDLYFLPGGNPDLRPEKGVSYDIGAAFSLPWISGSLTWFDSHIDDWIIWLPTTKGFFAPKNVKSVHAYGLEAKGSARADLTPRLWAELSGQLSWTISKNDGEPVSPADRSVGKQLPYTPKCSASATGRIGWRGWTLLYKWCYYSERFTMSSNDYTLTGHLPRYYMSNIAIDKAIHINNVELTAKLAINNLFGEDYISVLSRPMPGRNFELFIGIKI